MPATAEVTVSVAIPLERDGDSTERSLTLRLEGTEVVIEGHGGLYGTNARVTFDALADAFAILRSVHVGELRTIMGTPARDVIGTAAP